MSFPDVLARLLIASACPGTDTVVNREDLRELLRDWEKLDREKRSIRGWDKAAEDSKDWTANYGHIDQFGELASNPGFTDSPSLHVHARVLGRSNPAPRRNNGVRWCVDRVCGGYVITGKLLGKPDRHFYIGRLEWENVFAQRFAFERAIVRVTRQLQGMDF